MKYWRITYDHGKQTVVRARSKSAAVKYCTRVLDSDCEGCKLIKHPSVDDIYNVWAHERVAS